MAVVPGGAVVPVDPVARQQQSRALLACAEVTLRLAARDEVRAAWDRESACAGMSVGGLTHHTLAQLGHVARGLEAPAPAEAPVIALLEHYTRAPWVEASRRGEVDPEQNRSDDEAAAVGHAAVLAEAERTLAALPALLARPRDPDVVHIPWQGWSLATADHLTTRLMEMVVHGDDLAASVGLETPEHDPAVVSSVLGLLMGVSLRRHGQVALIRALSRPQRSRGDISAF